MALLLSLVALLLSSPSSASPALADRYISIIHHSNSQQPQEYLDPTLPPPILPANSTPDCSVTLFSHAFADTYGHPPFSAPYFSPPKCSSRCPRIILSVSISSAGDQYDRIAALWIGGVEILRTSTAEPTDTGIFWRIRKDVTRYSSLFWQPGDVTMMLENLVNDEFTGIYLVNASLDFYTEVGGELVSQGPAELILPVSNENGGSDGYWFRIQNGSELHSASVEIPVNAYKAVLEVYVSFHSNDEFWYSNPPDSYIKENNLTTGRGNGAFRQVCAVIDGRIVGSVVPFPVIFTGGINPLFWEPVVAIGAFDLPSYNLDVTPFLELMIDGKPHEIGLFVTDGISFWLVDANLHLWLDPELTSVTAKLSQYHAPPLTVVRKSKFHHLNGTFQIEAESRFHFSGWVNSSLGNLTTDVIHKLNFIHLIVFLNDGNYKKVYMKAKLQTVVKISEGGELVVSLMVQKFKFPLLIVTSTLTGENNTYTSRTNLSHALVEESSSLSGDRVVYAKILIDKQDADGWMLVQDHSVLSGSAGTQQVYRYVDSDGCYTREVSARDSELVSDFTTTSCLSLAS